MKEVKVCLSCLWSRLSFPIRCVLLIILLMSSTVVYATQPFLDTRTDYLVSGGGPNSLAYGDFNGDGKVDIAASGYYVTPTIFMGNGDGTFTNLGELSGVTSERIISADFNNDGKIDLAMVSTGSYNICLGNGDGTFQCLAMQSVDPVACSSWAYIGEFDTGDFNKDGKLDLAVPAGDGIAVLLGNGDGSFQSPVYYFIVLDDCGSTMEVTSGDYDMDGNIDLAVLGRGKITVFRGTGDGSFVVSATMAAAGGGIKTADFNKDGWLDLTIVRHGYTDNLVFFFGNGNGTFQTGLDYAGGGTYSYSLNVADLNGDGNIDVVVSGGSVLLGNGDGTFQTPFAYIPPGFDLPEGIVMADFDGDGHLDMAAGTRNSRSMGGFIGVFIGIGDGTFHQALKYDVGSTFYSKPEGVVVGDFNKDGKPDIATSNYGAGNISVLLGLGDGKFQSNIDYPAGTPSSIITADFNGDGNLDFAVTNSQDSGTVSILMGNGNGTFQPAVNYPAGTLSTSATAGDFNNDGKLDLAVYSTDSVSIFKGNGDGTFEAAGSFPGGGWAYTVYLGRYANWITNGDFNGDGKLDLAITDYVSGHGVSIYLGNGDFTFQYQAKYSTGGYPHYVITGDFNKDGILDLATADAGQDYVSVLIGVGDGTFNPALQYRAGLMPVFLAGGDFDSNGNPDLAVSNSGSNNISILYGKGAGTFEEAYSYGARNQLSSSIAFGDFDGNGTPDFAVTGSGGSTGIPGNVTILGIFDVTSPIGSVSVDTYETLFSDDAEHGLSNWVVDSSWGVTTSSYHGGTNSFTDSPSGNYTNSINSSLSMKNAVTISALAPTLTFWHKYATESCCDHAYVEISTNGGTSWNSLATYQGTLSTWTQVSIDLSSYINQSVKIRFRLNADGSTVNDGWYIDDVNISALISNPEYTNTTFVTLTTLCTDSFSGCSQMQFRNDGTPWSFPEPYATSKLWTLPPGDGTKTVYVKYMDKEGNWSGEITDSIVLHTVSPTVNAGPDRTETATFTQTATANDDYPMTYSWTKQSGPGSITFGSPNELATTITADMEGTYIIRFTAADAAGNSAYDDITLEWSMMLPTGSVSIDTDSGLSDNAENGMVDWIADSLWGITTSAYHGGANSFTDSPSGNYSNSINSSLTMKNAVTISALAPTLTFWHKYATESCCDHAYVEISADGGTNWTTLATYQGTLSAWTQVSIDLTGYINQAVKIRFRFKTDSSVVYDGWYIDDINLSFSLISNPEYTNTTSVTLTTTCADAGSGCSKMMVSNEADLAGAVEEDFATAKAWALIAGDGTKTVYAKYKDAAGNWSAVYNDTIILAGPVALSVTKSGSGTGTVTTNVGTLSWTGNTGVSIYDYKTPVTLTATADTGSTFSAWGGDADCLDGQVTMDAAKNCRAIFKSLDSSNFSSITCGDGQIDSIIDDFEDASLWFLCYHGAGVSCPTLANTGGCAGNSLSISYDLSTNPIGEGYVVITRNFTTPLDLSNSTHLRVALRGSNPKAHHTFQIKLVNHVGTQDYTYWRTAESVTDLPVWRPLYIDFKEFTCFGDPATICSNPPTLDVSAITRIELGVARCVKKVIENNIETFVECEPHVESENTLYNTNIFYLDELAAVDLRPGAKNRLVQTSLEQVVLDPDLRSFTANAILNHQDTNDLVPAWFDVTDPSYPNYNTYSEAIALHLFIDEYERTGNVNYKNASNRLAGKLMKLQIPDGKNNAGAWYTAYKNGTGGIVSMDESSCDGNEILTADIDRCSWIGNTGWAVIALTRLQNSGIYPDASALRISIDKAASWMVSQIGRISAYPGLVTEGMEGNISTYFGLVAAGRNSEASWLGDNIYLHGWDSTEQRMKIGANSWDYATAMDVSGSWGVQFLRHIGKQAEALSSQGYAASILRTTSFDTSNPAGALVSGYGDIAGPWTMTVEFGGQAASAGILYSNQIMEQISLLQDTDGSFPGSTDNWYGGTVAPWTTTMTGVAPTAWVYFAQNVDPILTIHHDNTAPSVTISSTASNLTNVSPIPVTVTFSETVTGLIDEDVVIGNGTISNFTGSGTTYTFSVTPTLDGAVTVNVAAGVAQDAAGNGNTAAAQLSRTFDNTAPTATITGTPSSPTNSTSATLTVAGMDVVAYKYKLDSGAYSTETLVATPISLSGLSEGNHTVSVIGKDPAGNWQAAGSATTATWTVDSTAPVTTISGTPSSPTSATSAILTVGGTDVVAYKYKLDAGAYSSETIVSTQIALSGLSEGSHTISVIGKDTAGNWQATGAATTATWTVDTTAPTATIMGTPSSPTNSTAATLTVGSTDVVAYKYKLDGGAYSSETVVATPISLSGLSEGSHTVSVIGKDTAGNWQLTTNSTTATWTVDVTVPVLTVSTLSDGSWTNSGTLNISGTATDNMGLPALTINGNPVDVTPDGTFSYPFTLTVGPNTINTIVSDLVGLQAADTRTINFDPTAPYITITTPSDNSVTKQSSITVTGTVDESSVVTVEVNTNEPLPAQVSGNDFTINVALNYGTNTVEVTATDLATNQSTLKRTVTSDNQKPSVSITEPNQDIRTNQSSILLKGEVTDLTATAVTITKDQETYTPPVASGKFEQLLTFTTEKTYQIFVTATDAAGNVSSAQRNIIYDITPPSISLNPVASPTNNTTQVLTGSVDAASIVTVLCSTANVSEVTYPTETTWMATLTNMAAVDNAVKVYATDDVGNKSDEIAASIIIDTIPPDTNITSTPSIPTTSGSASFSFTSTEENSTFQCQMDAGYQPCVSPKTYTGLAAGSHTFSVKATDAAGNTDLKPAVYIWTIDTVAPEVSATTPTKDTTPTWTWTSGGGGNGTFRYRLDNPVLTTGATITTLKTFTPAIALANGNHTLYVQEKNTAGLWSATGSKTVLIDTAVPLNGTVTATAGAGLIQLNWSGFKDASSGIATYKIVYAKGTAPTSCATGTVLYSGNSLTYTHTGLINQTYGYRVCAIDNAGNISTGVTKTAKPAAAESNPPSGSVLINGGAAWTKKTAVTLDLAAADESGITQYCLSNTSTCTTWTTVTATTNLSITKTWTLSTGNGAKTVNVWFKDTWGTPTPAPYTDTIGLDTTAPINGTMTATPGAGNIQLDWSGFSDGLTGSGIASYKVVYAKTTAPSSCAIGTVLYSGTNLTYTHTGLINQTYGYRVCAIDNAGNISTGVTKTAKPLPTESNPPAGSILIKNGDEWTKSAAVTLNLTATDDSMPIQMCISNTTTCTIWTAYAATKSWTLLTGNGLKTVYVKYRDTWGNTTLDPYTDTITLDGTAPVNGTLTANPGAGQIALSWSGFTDALSGVAGYKVVYATGIAPASCSAGTVVPGYDGVTTSYTHTGLNNLMTYFYRVCAIDRTGNMSTGATKSAKPL